MKKLRKLIAVTFALALLAGVMTVTAFAAEEGTQSNPKIVEPFTMLDNAYLMNDSLAAGDADGIWYSMTAHRAGILYVEVNCSASVAYDVAVTAGGYTGLASKGSPVITYPVQKGDKIIVHKFVKADSSGNYPALSDCYVSGYIVEGDEDYPLNMISTTMDVPVTAGDSVCLTEKNNRVNYYGRALIVSGNAEDIRNTTVRVGSNTYTDVDYDGKIELMLPGGYESRPTITVVNNGSKNAVYTFQAVDEASESEPSYTLGDITGDGQINNDDVVYLLWNTLFPDQYPLQSPGDINGDGRINNDDVVKLLWYTLFPEEYPLS